MVWVVNANYISEYKIQIVFNDNSEVLIDFQEILQNDKRSIFQELLDINRFKDFKVEMDTIIWSNGLDLAPEYLKQLQNSSVQGQSPLVV